MVSVLWKKMVEMITRILVPLDGSYTAEKVLRVVRGEARCHEATIVLMRVIPPFRQLQVSAPHLVELVNQKTEKAAESYLTNIANGLRLKDFNVEVIIERGSPAYNILKYAQSGNCDLVILGTHGETGSKQWGLGGITSKIVRAKLSIPVMIVPT
jgi:nucleotide-binding universal stress UspA family protein